MARYRNGPFDVQSVLSTHERVTETAVMGVPDPLPGEVLEAYVVLRAGDRGDDALVAELKQLVKEQFAAHAYPRVVCRPRRIHLVKCQPTSRCSGPSSTTFASIWPRSVRREVCPKHS